MIEKHPLLNVEKVTQSFSKPACFKVLHNIDLLVSPGSVHSVVGESGSGKTTLANVILGFYKPDEGHVYFDGQDISSLSERTRKSIRRSMQVVFQNASSALNPYLKVYEILTEPFLIHKNFFGPQSRKSLLEKADELVNLVGLSSDDLFRYAKDFSGGQKQRLNIARAIALQPKLLIADEPVSSLDVTIKVHILQLLMKLKKDLKLSMLLISHDLHAVRLVSDVISVMYLGRIVETSKASSIIKNPLHPYTKALLDSTASSIKTTLTNMTGDVPSPLNPPKGCPFHPRCPKANDNCKLEVPKLRNMGTESEPHFVSCH